MAQATASSASGGPRAGTSGLSTPNSAERSSMGAPVHVRRSGAVRMFVYSSTKLFHTVLCTQYSLRTLYE